VRIADDFKIFEFNSIGNKGTISKQVMFTPTEIPGIVNLCFGDIDEKGQLSDYIISNNGDRNKILATIVYIAEIFLNKYPDYWIYLKGSTEERMRLYRMAVGINLEELSSKFDIYAEQINGFVHFQKNIETRALLVKRKIS